jgi:hypothetical protein
VVALTGLSPVINRLAGEVLAMGLRCGLITFNKLEMAV